MRSETGQPRGEERTRALEYATTRAFYPKVSQFKSQRFVALPYFFFKVVLAVFAWEKKANCYDTVQYFCVPGSHDGSLDCPSRLSIAFIYVKKVYRVSWGYRGFLFQVAEQI